MSFFTYMQDFPTRDEAFAAGRQVKGRARAKKEALVHHDWRTLRQQAWRSRSPMPAHLA